MCQKSIINDPKTAVQEMLEGISYAYPGLFVDAEKGIVMINRDRKNKVALVCGSGAGYEPFATGFVGEGMLTGYITGKVGRAPNSNIILSVLTQLCELNKGGVLILILNYSREVLNFGLAIERARCQGMKVESVVLVDDCSRWKAMREEHYTNLTYKKGLCGSVFTFKILGALSSAGASMPYLVSEARALNFRTTTLGFCLEPFCYPGSREAAFRIDENDIVIGLGINGENGIKVIDKTSAEDVINEVISLIFSESNLSHKSAVFVLINTLASLSAIESYIIAKEVTKYLAKKKVLILRQIVGSFFTSFDAKGAHISILNVTGKGTEWLSYLDKETEAFAWPNMKLSMYNPDLSVVEFTDESGPQPRSRGGMQLPKLERAVFRKCITAVCEAFIDAEIILNQLDAYGGNGDTGTKLVEFAYSVLKRMSSMPTKYVSMTFQILERIAEETMGGKIGSVYSALLCGASYPTTNWAGCFKGAVRFLGIHVPIVTGFRTMFDVLKPACSDFVEYYLFLGEELWRASLQIAVDTAEKACYETSKTIPKIGVYHPDKKMNMDAGAYSVVVWMRAVNDTLKQLCPATGPLPEGDWRYKLETLLFAQRPVERVSPLKYEYEQERPQVYLTDYEDDEEDDIGSLEETDL